MGRRRTPFFLSQFQPYLTVLAVVDTFLIILFLVDNVIIGHIATAESDWYYTVVPYITHPVKTISITMSMVWVVVIAIERFLAVTLPLYQHDQDTLYGYITFLIIFSITSNMSK